MADPDRDINVVMSPNDNLKIDSSAEDKKSSSDSTSSLSSDESYTAMMKEAQTLQKKIDRRLSSRKNRRILAAKRARGTRTVTCSQKTRKQTTGTQTIISFTAIVEALSKESQSADATPTLFCNYCKRLGHTLENCRKRRSRPLSFGRGSLPGGPRIYY